jgi:hypothetical protein
MKRLLTLDALCIVMALCVLPLNATAQGGDPRMAIASGAAAREWETHRHLSSQVSGTCRTTSSLVEGAKKSRTEEEYRFRDGGGLLIHHSGGLGQIFGYNDSYRFSLKRDRRRDLNASWDLTRLFTPPHTGDGAKIPELIVPPNTLATSISGNIFVGDFLADAGTRIVEQALRGELVVASLLHEPTGKKETWSWPRAATITFDPANKFVIKKWRVVHTSGSVSEAELDYRLVDDLPILTERRLRDWKSEDPKDLLGEGVEEFDLTYPAEEIPAEKFMLSDFGIPEPLIPSR